jgi:Na+/melibiose symporter-like transporter
MYKHQVRVLQAWRMFIPILASHLVYFLVYGLFLLLLAIGVGIAIVFAGCLTCCVGFLLLALPYIGSVILLPIGFIYRDFSLEFLAQWGPEYSVFPNPE